MKLFTLFAGFTTALVIDQGQRISIETPEPRVSTKPGNCTDFPHRWRAFDLICGGFVDGTTIKTGTAENFDDCSIKCADVHECRGFNYHRFEKSCVFVTFWSKSWVPDESYDSGFKLSILTDDIADAYDL